MSIFALNSVLIFDVPEEVCVNGCVSVYMLSTPTLIRSHSGFPFRHFSPKSLKFTLQREETLLSILVKMKMKKIQLLYIDFNFVHFEIKNVNFGYIKLIKYTKNKNFMFRHFSPKSWIFSFRKMDFRNCYRTLYN